MNLRLSKYLVTSPAFQDSDDGAAKLIAFSTRSGRRRLIGIDLWNRLTSGRFESVPDRVLDDLADISAVVGADEDELAAILDDNDAASAESDQLYLVIQPSASCPLDCWYCGQKHTTKSLDTEHQDLFLEQVNERLARGNYRHLRICWFGGEPLTAMDVMRRMTSELIELAAKHGCCYSSKVVTAGTLLTVRVAEELVREMGANHLEITLDGTAAAHDRRRYTKKGRPSFQRIFDNLVDVARQDDLQFTFTVRCNVDRTNRESVSPLLRMIADAGIQRRIGFYIMPLHDWGNDAGESSLKEDEFARWEIEWFAEMIQLGFEPGLIPPRKSNLCLATMPEGSLVDAYGNLFNCTEVSYVPAYGEPNEYRLGTVESGEDEVSRQRLLGWNDEIRTRSYPCSECEMLPVCGGGCPKLWHEGRLPCPSAKHNIGQRLLLAHLRERRTASEPDASPRAERT